MVLALAFDALRVGLAHADMISERRMNKLLALQFRDPEAFLEAAARNAEERRSGGLLSYAAAAILAELKHLAAPATLECPSLDLDVEDHATLAPLTVTLTRRALRQLESILAIEALLAVSTLGAQPTLPPLGAGTRAAYDTVRGAIATAGHSASAATVAEAARHALFAHGATV
jgi:histidine ammonia-lyase